MMKMITIEKMLPIAKIVEKLIITSEESEALNNN
jgi:hypothetical protein